MGVHVTRPEDRFNSLTSEGFSRALIDHSFQICTYWTKLPTTPDPQMYNLDVSVQNRAGPHREKQKNPTEKNSVQQRISGG